MCPNRYLWRHICNTRVKEACIDISSNWNIGIKNDKSRKLLNTMDISDYYSYQKMAHKRKYISIYKVICLLTHMRVAG